MRFSQRVLAVLAALALLSSAARAADHVKFGVFKVVGTSPVFIAEDKGYFAAEGLDVELVPFTAQEPLVLGIASGDLDFGATAFTGGFYNLAGQGALKIIGAFIHEAPGFQANTLITSNRAYEAGLKSPKDIANRSAAVPEVGNPAQYGLNSSPINIMSISTPSASCRWAAIRTPFRLWSAARPISRSCRSASRGRACKRAMPSSSPISAMKCRGSSAACARRDQDRE